MTRIVRLLRALADRFDRSPPAARPAPPDPRPVQLQLALQLPGQLPLDIDLR